MRRPLGTPRSQLRTDCGCGEATAGMLAGLALGVIIVTRHGVAGIAGTLWAAGTVVVLTIAGVVGGKLIGLGMARVRSATRRRRVMEWSLNRAKRSDHGILR